MTKTGKFIKCQTCNKEFYIPINRFKSAKFCSPKCRGDSAHKRFTGICKICGKSFDYIATREGKAKYCSRKCFYKAMRHKGTVTINCDWCGKEIKKSPSHIFKTNYCSMQCYANGSSGNIKKLRQLGYCQICGWNIESDILVIHHKDRNHKNNDIDNLQLLCWNCHMLEHYHSKDGTYNGKSGKKHRVD